MISHCLRRFTILKIRDKMFMPWIAWLNWSFCLETLKSLRICWGIVLSSRAHHFSYWGGCCLGVQNFKRSKYPFFSASNLLPLWISTRISVLEIQTSFTGSRYWLICNAFMYYQHFFLRHFMGKEINNLFTGTYFIDSQYNHDAS